MTAISLPRCAAHDISGTVGLMDLTMRILPKAAVILAMAALPTAGQAIGAPQAQPAAKPAILLPDGDTQTTQYDPSKGFPDRNGNLSGMMFVIPAKEMTAFTDKSEDRQLDRVSRAEAGADLAIKLVFTGVKPDPNGVVNLTYDLKITGPDGKLYGTSDYHSLVAVIGQVGPEQALYDNRAQVIHLQFDPKDKPGAYRIDAVLHDRIAGIDLPLTTQVEMLPPGYVAPESASTPTAAATDVGQTASATMAEDVQPAAETAPDKTAPAKAKSRRKRRHRH